MTTIDVLRQALEAIEDMIAWADDRASLRTAIRAEIERLEKVEQEPRMQVVGHGRENGAQYLDITLRGIAVSHIREKALEEAAKVCDLLLADPISSEWSRATHECAAAIRRLMERNQ